MGKKSIKMYIAYGVIFFVICIFPFAGMLFYQEQPDKEKKILAVFPQLSNEEKLNINYAAELGDYFLDHFAFRTEMVTVNAALQRTVFGISTEDTVIAGSDGWLYYKDSLDDYLGRNVMSEERLNHTVRTIGLIQEYVEAYDKQFVFTIAPNKCSLYPEYMPYYYKKISEDNNLTLITEKLNEKNIPYVDLQEAFTNDEEILYHRLDSHWNNKGAVKVLNLLLDQLGKEHDTYEEVSSQFENVFEGDLYGMLYPAGNEKDDNVIYDKEFTYKYTASINTTNDIKIQTVNTTKQGKVVMFRDSFGDSLLPFAAEEYGEGFFTREVPYPVKAINEYDADTLIFEVVERHLGLLTQSIPLMGALEKDIEIEASSVDDGCQTMTLEDDEEFVKVYGTLDPYYVDGEMPVYVRLVSGETVHTYEAFPIAEGSEEEDILFDYGYGLYIDKEDLENGSYEIEVLTQAENEWYTSEFLKIYEY